MILGSGDKLNQLPHPSLVLGLLEQFDNINIVRLLPEMGLGNPVDGCPEPERIVDAK